MLPDENLIVKRLLCQCIRTDKASIAVCAVLIDPRRVSPSGLCRALVSSIERERETRKKQASLSLSLLRGDECLTTERGPTKQFAVSNIRGGTRER